MTVQAGPTFKRYAANGVTTVFAIPFLLLDAADLVVTLNDVPVTSGFTLSGIGGPSSSATFSTAPTGDLLFRLVVPFQRLFDYQENGDFLATTVNADFDRIWLAIKQLYGASLRAITVPELEPEGVESIPDIESRALKLLSFDAYGNPIVVAAASQSATDLELRLADIASLVLIGGKTAAAIGAGTAWDQVIVGKGVKGFAQTNVGVRVQRDITATTPSYHGFNESDYFAANGNAINPFGSDIRIGDGTQLAGFALGHVNSFQCTDVTDLGGGLNAQHFAFISQPVLKSGTISRTRHFSAIDQLGVRDTPGFGVADFELNGPAIGNNQTGVSTVIRHGTNAKSLHIQAGSTDAGATLTSGGAVSDFETPIVVRQATASTSKASGAVILTAGGIGCSGSVFAGAEVSAGDANPQLALRDASNVLRARMTHDGTTMRVRAETGTLLRLGVSAADHVELLTDRFRPVVDNALNCGDASHRWIQLFAATATIGTSDERAKQDIRPIDDALLDAWADVQPVLFRFRDAVEKKSEAARLHAGYIAQQVRDTLSAHGVNGFDYALLCEDELTEEVTELRTVKVPRVETVQIERESFEVIGGVLTRIVSVVDEERHVTEQMQVFNADGTPYLVDGEEIQETEVGKDKDGNPIIRPVAFQVKRPLVQTVAVMDEAQEPFTVTRKTGETRMGLRYEHCLVIECAYLRRELSRVTGKRQRK